MKEGRFHLAHRLREPVHHGREDTVSRTQGFWSRYVQSGRGELTGSGAMLYKFKACLQRHISSSEVPPSKGSIIFQNHASSWEQSV